MGRNRQARNKGLPPNLYTAGVGYKYRHPVTRKDSWMGTDRDKAIEAAKKLNAILIPAESTLVDRVLGIDKSVADAVEHFRTNEMPTRKWSAKTRADYDAQLERIIDGIGSKPLATFSVKECADFLRPFEAMARTRQQFRLLLQWIFAGAVEEGWMDANPALVTKARKPERQRQRLTLEAYNAIREKAAPWLQRAMDLSLVTLLRREDVCSVRFSDWRDGCLWVVPQKTEGSTGVRLQIEVAAGGELEQLLRSCRDEVLSPFIIHRKPEKARPRHMRAGDREHHTQVLPEQLSRAFQEARELAGIEGDNPPTFHEIRSLGGKLLRDQGWTLDQVQALMGHASEEMTKLYMEGHEVPWQRVTTGIKLAR